MNRHSRSRKKQKNRQGRQRIRLKRERKRADVEIQRARRKAKSEIDDMKERQFFWDWGYLTVISFSSSEWGISEGCIETHNDTNKLVQRIYSVD